MVAKEACVNEDEMQFVINTIAMELARQSGQERNIGKYLYDSPCSLASELMHLDVGQYGEDQVDWLEVAMNVAHRFPAFFSSSVC